MKFVTCHMTFSGPLLSLLAGVLLLAGCVSAPPPADPFFEQWRAKAETAKPYTLAHARPNAQPTGPGGQALPSQGQGPQEKEGPDDEAKPAPIDLPGTPISVRFIDDDLATSLRALAAIAHQNILISPSVQGKLNLQTQETPWNTVFMGIINSYGLTVVKKDNMLHVMSMDDLKQQVERESLHLQKQQVAELVTRIVPIEFSDPKAIVESVTQLLSKDKEGKPRGSATVDQHSRSLVVRETQDAMDSLLALIRDLDKPTSQILIEAHIVETTKDVARELGVRWGGVAAVQGDPTTVLTTGGGKAFVDSAKTPPFQYETENIYNVDLGASAIKGINPASVGLLINAADGILAAQLSALQQDGKLNILSSPSIATLDNAEAVIESGKSVPVQTTSVSGGSTQTTTEYKDATLNLTVTPHVISERAIKLNIKAKKDEVDLTNNVSGNPFIIKKLAQTQLIVENNATVVLAGLSKETHADSNSGVPGVKDVPGLGWLFKKDSRSKNFEELLIFITPKILVKPEGHEAAGAGHAGP